MAEGVYVLVIRLLFTAFSVVRKVFLSTTGFLWASPLRTALVILLLPSVVVKLPAERGDLTGVEGEAETDPPLRAP